MTWKRWAVCCLGLMIFGSGCQNGSLDPLAADADVTIQNQGTHFEVTLDRTRGATPGQIGEAYGRKIRRLAPDFERTIDSYIQEVTVNYYVYRFLLWRVDGLRPQLPAEYREEIDGMVSAFSGGNFNWPGDGRLSRDEIYFVNLMGDIYRFTECAGLAVHGPRSATGSTLTARLFDFIGGSKNQLARFPAVITIRNGENSVCLISYLGLSGAIAGFNVHKVFAGVLDSQTYDLTYTTKDKRSYMLDLRWALEHCTTLDEVGQFMIDPAREYTINHLIFLSDPQTSKVVENNISGQGTNQRRALRTTDSELHDGVVWGIDHALACVNAFMLKGNHDNFNGVTFNTARWESFRRELLARGETITFEQLRQIATFHTGEVPGVQADGDIYSIATQNIVLFEPQTLRLEIFFRPVTGSLPAQPTFVEIPVTF